MSRSFLRNCLAAWAFAFAGHVHATTWTVDSTSADPGLNACTAAPADCSFPGAVNRMAQVGDSIVFTVASSSATEVELGKDAIIDAAGARLPKLVITTRGVGWATVTLRNARFEQLNGGIYPGGALQISRLQIVTIEDSVFLNNRSNAHGGAIYNEGTLRVTRSRFEGNYSVTGAGGIHSTNNGSLAVVDSTFRGNGMLNPSTFGHFGAVSAENTLDISGCLFHENQSKYASAVRGGALTRIHNSTFVGNRTYEATEGGALLLGGPVRIANSTIVGNSGISSGGLYVYPSSDTQVVNTIIANNTGASPEVGGRIYSHGYNLIRDRTGALVAGNVPGTDIYATDPRLAPLGNYGGPTMGMMPTPESPALNAGSSCVLTGGGCGDFPHIALSTDQRGAGFARSRGGVVDIGALELGSVLVTNNQDSGAGSLRQAISDALPGDVVSFSPSYFNQPRTIALASTLVVNKSLSIVGPGANLLTLDANNQRRHLNVDAPATLNLRGLRFTRGNPGVNVGAGAILVNLGTLNASEIVIDDSTGHVGGCLYNNGTLNLARARLSGCRAATHSAGIFNETGRTATISDTRIENNVSTGPAGGIGNPGTLVLDRVSLSGNQATIGGGLNSYGSATLTNVTVSGNSAENGGGMYLGGTGTTTLTHATVTANTAQYNGGVGAEFDAIVNLRATLIAGNTRTVDQALDAGGNFTSFGHNLIGSTIGLTFRANSPSLVGNLIGVQPRLAALADHGGSSLTHAPLHDSPIIDAASAGTLLDGRGLSRPVDFTHLANASGGNGSDIGAYELQVATPTAVTAVGLDGALSVSFTGGDRGGLAITGYTATCGTQSASGTSSPIVVGGLSNGNAVSCTVRAQAGSVQGIPSAPSASAAPGTPPGAPTLGTVTAANGQARVTFSAPANTGGLPISGYTATCGARSASAAGSPISVIGLVNGTPVSCTVKASNSAGSGPESAPSGPVTPGLPGAFAYIPRVSQASLAVVDLATNSVLQNIGLSGGHGGVAASPDGARIYLVSQTTGNVSVIDTQVRAQVATIAVGASPWSAVVSPDSTRIYVSNSGNSTVSVIDAASNSVTATIPVFNQPYGLAITPDGSRLFVANGGSNAVSVIDTASQQVVATLTAGMDPIGVATSPDGRRAYVSSQTQNNLTVIDVASASVIGTVAVGSTAYGVAVSRDSRQVYVGNANGNSVSVVDAETRAVIATIPVGARPEGIDVSADGAEVYVVNRDSGTISRISTATNTVVGSVDLGGGAPFAMGRFVSVGGRTPAFTSDPPPAGQLGVPYSHVLATTGSPAASFLLASGNLPPGLTLAGATISGTPTALGNSPFSIRASNGVAGSVTESWSITIYPTVPGAPTISSVVRGDASVEVSFSAPSSNGGSPVTGYTATCGTRSQAGTESPIVVADLVNGTPVTCTVLASNAIGNGQPSAPSQSVTPATIPDAPVIGTAVAGDGTIEVHFTPPANDGGSPITDYTALCSVAASGPQSPVVLNNLPNGMPQRCRVFAINAVGGGPASAYSNEVTPQATTTLVLTSNTASAIGGQPVTFTASVSPASASGQVSFTTGASSTGCAPAPLVNGSASCTTTFTAAGSFAISASYVGDAAHRPSTAQLNGGQTVVAPTITIATDLAGGIVGTAYGPTQLQASGGVAPHAFMVTQGALPGGLTLSASGLLSGTPTTSGQFGFTITATDSNQFTGSRAYTVDVVGVPAAPTAVSATRGNGQVTVAFTPSGNDGGQPVTGYLATCGSQSQQGLGSPITVTGLANGVAVTCTVLATNAIGNSAPSAPSNSVTPATLPGAPQITAVTPGNGALTIAFQPPAQDGGAPLIDSTLRCAPGLGVVTGSSPLTLTGLSNNTLYRCTVSARNEVGAGPESGAASAIPAATLSANLSITKSNGRNFVTGGEPVRWTITVSNPGPAGVAQARVQDPLDPDFSAASWTCVAQGGAACAPSGNGNLDERVDLPAGSSVVFQLTATVAALPETPVSNIVSVLVPAPLDDPELGNNVANDGPDVRGLFRDGLE